MPPGRPAFPRTSLARIVMAFFLRASSTPDTRFLEWKVRLFTIGAVLALAGMYLELHWMVGVAIGFLVAGFSLRFARAGSGDAGSREGSEEEDPTGDTEGG